MSSSTRIAAAAASSCFRDCFSRSLWRLDMLSIHFTSRSTTRFFILSRCSSFFAFCAIHCCTRASGAVSSARERFGIAAFAGGLRRSYGDAGDGGAAASGVRGDATGARED